MTIYDNKISNVIGTHIPNWLLKQLETRSKKISETNRDNANLQYLGNKTGWVRLVSSIKLKSQDDRKYFSELTGLSIANENDLAKNFVLYGGVSKYNKETIFREDGRLKFNFNDINTDTKYALRKGFKETYSLLGDQEVRDFGYRPMPGLIRVVVETQGKLGSIRSATIDFKVWDKSQLDVMDALYFKLGYSMFLEWGNTFYYDNNETLLSSELLVLDPFEDRLTKGKINSELGKKRRESKGNYDGMLGMVSNFSFSFNQEGGYDCVLKLVGIGAISDSIQINQPTTIPDLVKAQVEALTSIYGQLQIAEDKKADDAAAAKAASDAELKKQEELEKLEELKSGTTSIFNAIVQKQEEEKGIKSSAKNATASNIESLFLENHGVPSSEIISTQKSLDYNQRGQYDYIYEDKLYLTKKGVILTGDEQKTSSYGGTSNTPRVISKDAVNSIILDSAYIKAKVFPNLDLASLANNKELYNESSGFTTNKVYFSAINTVNNLKYTKGYPYQLGINLEFPQEGRTGSSITYEEGNKRSIVLEFLKAFLLDAPTRGSKLQFDTYKLSINQNELRTGFTLYLSGFYKVPSIVTDKKSQIDQTTGDYSDKTTQELDTINFPITISVDNDSSLISFIELPSGNVTSEYIDSKFQRGKLAKQNTPGATVKENTSPASNTNTEATKRATQYQSSLEAMLRAIQVYSLQTALTKTKAISLDRKVIDIPLADDTKFYEPLFSNGMFSKNIKQIIDGTLSKNPYNDNIAYGFNAALLSNKVDTATLTDELKVDYKALLTCYVLPYEINQDITEGTKLNHPVYIQLGFLMFMLNHCCNLYEKTDIDGKTTPLLYMDFNPKTNFCLSHPCQMTTDAMKFLIPFQGTFEAYKNLFLKEVLTDDGKSIKSSDDKFPTATTLLFNPENKDETGKEKVFDTISGNLPSFKGAEEVDANRGAIMKVLVNIDYVFDIIKQFFSRDETNAVYLKAFVEQVLSDMNKSLGNLNIFRFFNDDSADCLQVVDDQLVPGLVQEVIVDNTGIHHLPLYGKGSIARSLDLRTDISSRIAKTLAVSANSEVSNKSSNSTDGTPFGYINTGYADRIMEARTEISSTDKKEGEQPSLQNADLLSGTIASAMRFNTNVIDFYGTYNPSTENINHATNYLIEKISKNKLDKATRAAAMIPITINFTLDGISGFNMMQGFTISDKFLPYTYNLRKLKDSKDAKVGFMVTGNVHTIENNQWTTAIKANMTYLKERGDFKGTLNKSLRKGVSANFNAQNAGSNNNNTNFVATDTEALAIVETYLQRGKITPADFNALISAVGAEAGNNQEERAWVAGVILNRTRTGIQGGTTILGTLKKPSQFQAVTGTSANGNTAAQAYIDGPGESKAANIYGAIKNYLTKVPKDYLYFTSNIDAAYGPGTDPSFKTKLLAKGGKVIGDTVFSTQA